MSEKKEKIGIIGLGWLGEKLASELQDLTYSVWGTVRGEDKAKRLALAGIHAITWQSGNPLEEDLKEALSDSDFLVLNIPPSAFKDISYAAGLASFLQYISSETKVIFTSSTGVYPNNLEDATEDYSFKPEESNALLEAENVLIQQLGNRLCILRLAGLIGEDRNPVFYLAKKEINQDPDKRVNLIHRKDIIHVIQQVLGEGHFGEIFNVCNPDHPTRKKYYNKMAQLFNLPSIQFTHSENNSINKIVNCSKLQVTFSYEKFENLEMIKKIEN